MRITPALPRAPLSVVPADAAPLCPVAGPSPPTLQAHGAVPVRATQHKITTCSPLLPHPGSCPADTAQSKAGHQCHHHLMATALPLASPYTTDTLYISINGLYDSHALPSASFLEDSVTKVGHTRAQHCSLCSLQKSNATLRIPLHTLLQTSPLRVPLPL